MRAQPLILVTDDDRDTRELYRACFDLSGFRTAEAATGAQAIALTRRILPDVLLTDLVLPDFDGCEVAASLRSDALTAHVCVFLVTGHPSPDLWSKATTAGIERLFTKPCAPRVLLREVQRALARRQSGGPLAES